MSYMFYKSSFNQSIDLWDVSKVENMKGMFNNSQFNQDTSLWNVNNIIASSIMFKNCPAPIPWWYSENAEEIRFKLKEKEVEELNIQLPVNSKTNSKVKI